MFEAKLGDQVIARAHADDVIHIEGNVYFPPSAVVDGVLRDSPTPYTCPWKGACQYFSVRDGEDWLTDRAWSYPEILPTAVDRVGRDFAGYVAFWKDVQVERVAA
ncbi:DUF427 domain-containing protein [Protaetiibacter mangrovi]|uniref:DUF427 domain-containing protein n=1 Tax=Protaetiibacter mangrovi TaxID=2970926 RepID=A0ABT1ZD41_9MICO|nr:DUF427 domain-containing protein [Protaetiibacter mangrovi]MCS0498610.1 DUF427 domain-containing protein [Protaetiibacter mangrovi]TPX05694.1 DUF427 domain-containing protein [Schumannella luteola]